MHLTDKLEQEVWENSAIERIVDLVKTVDGDLVAVGKLSEVVDEPYCLQKIIEFISKNPQGKQVFQERPCLGNIDLHELYRLPHNTLGHNYANHMLENDLKPLGLEAQQIESDLQFVRVHIAQTHDIWHVATGCNTNLLGELQLEAFYVAQLYTTRFWLALIAKNLIKAVVYDIETSTQYMDAITKGWLMGKQAKTLFGIQWKHLWEKPLEEVRTSLNIVPIEV
ncbi:MAG: Coq4 family protein [Cyanobacteria bacterium J06639_18]